MNLSRPLGVVLCGSLLLAPAAFADEDGAIRNFRYCLDSIDQNLGGRNAETLGWWKDQCQAKLDQISDAAKGTPEFATQKARWDKDLAAINPLVGGAQAGSDTETLLRKAMDSYQITSDPARAPKAFGETGAKIVGVNKDLQALNQCLTLIGQAKQADPQWATRKVPADGSSGADLEKKCQDRKASAEKVIDGMRPEWEAAGKKKAKELYARYQRLVRGEDYPAKLEGSKDPLDAMDAEQRYHFLAEEGRDQHTDLKNALATYPFLADYEVAKGLTVKAMEAHAQELWDKGAKGQARWADKAQKAAGLYDRELAKALSGDRLRLVKDQGRPNWTSNMNDRAETIRASIKSYGTASWFRYDGDGCNVTYYFSGSKISRTKKEGPNCQ